MSKQIYRLPLIFEIIIFIQAILATFYISHQNMVKKVAFLYYLNMKRNAQFKLRVHHYTYFKNKDMKTYTEIFYFPLYNTR